MNIRRLARIAMFGTLLYVAQVGLSFIPNIELVSLFLLIITLVFEKEGLYASLVFILLEGIQWGFGLWWFGYIYVWPLLYFFVITIKKFNKGNDFIIWAIVLGFYGLSFGALYALSYIPVSINYAFAYWFAGIPFDLVHGVGNVILTLILGKPLYKILLQIKSQQSDLK